MRGFARQPTYLWFAATVGCSAGPPVASSVPATPVTSSSLPEKPRPPKPPISPASLPGDYRAALISSLKGTFRGNIVEAGLPEVVVVRQRGRKKRDIVVTTSLGRAPRPKGDARVELMAHVPAYGPGVGEVLAALSARIDKLTAYEAVELPKAVRTLKYFDLLPGTEISVLGAPVRLYRVVPLTADEFETAAESEGSQWVGGELADPGASARTLERWAPALDG